jgi:hypothetical protein
MSDGQVGAKQLTRAPHGRKLRPPIIVRRNRMTSSMLGAFDLRRIGTCPKCMRVSFAFLLAGWCAFFALSGLSDGGMPWAILVIAVIFTLLWASHVVARAYRDASAQSATDAGRRVVFGTFARAIVGAALVSAALLPSQNARADSGCGGWAGGNGCSPCTSCQRQTSGCSCYDCKSCGSNCSSGDC